MSTRTLCKIVLHESKRDRLHRDLGPALLVTLAVEYDLHHPCQHHPSPEMMLPRTERRCVIHRRCDRHRAGTAVACTCTVVLLMHVLMRLWFMILFRF